MPILKNSNNGVVTIHAVANSTFVIAGNSTVSNVAIGAEIVRSASIRRIHHGAQNVGYWIVARGANTVAVLSGTDVQDYVVSGNPITLDPTANLVVTLVGTTNGYIMVEMIKTNNAFSSVY